MNVKQTIISVIVFLLVGLMFIKTWSSAKGEVQSDIPIMNDAWANSLQAIHDDSENNPGKPWEKGIITSWWDFGHHFKYMSDRAVTFDGGTQVTPQAYWVGKLLISSSEDKSLKILRMLDCGGNKAFDELNLFKNDTPKTIDVFDSYFNNQIPAPEAHMDDCSTPAYVIASEDMVGKAGVWGHFGSWDFNRADMWINVKKMNKSDGMKYILDKGYTSDESNAYSIWWSLQGMTESEANNWIAPWPGYAGTNDCSTQNSSIICSNGITVTDGDVILPNGQIPQSFVYIKDGSIVEKKYPNATLQYSFILTPDNKLIASTPDLANSLFTKLFFMNATGLKHFKLLTEQKGIDNFRIFVYKVDWNG